MRTRDAQERKLWTKQHGQDTYGDEDDEEVHRKEEIKPTKKELGKERKPCNKCGSTTHSRSTHKDCPFNKKNTIHKNESTQLTTKPTQPAGTDNMQDESPGLFSEHDECIRINSSSDNYADSEVEDEQSLIFSDSELDIEEFEDIVIAGCTCGALNRAHKKTCPMNSRVRYTKQRRERKAQLQVGDYVCLHSGMLKNKHLFCRVAEQSPGRVASVYKLVWPTGVLRGLHAESELTSCQVTPEKPISMDKWRTKQTISLKAACNDPQNLQTCTCTGEEMAVSKNQIGLTNAPNECTQNDDKLWVTNPIYVLHESDRDIIISPAGWLNDKIIDASQKLLLQHFPSTNGLQPPTLEQINGFQAHTGHFAQVLNVRNSHWIFVCNLGCDDNEVFVYDTMYSSLPQSTLDTIAHLSFCSSPVLSIKMVQVDLQKKSSDCGVLSLAMAYDVLSNNGPHVARYDHTQIRQHLCECLSNCCLTPFPVLSREPQQDTKFKSTIEVELFCICRMPEHAGEAYAECEECKQWFHQNCLNIPEEVFDEDFNKSWLCNKCVKKS